MVGSQDLPHHKGHQAVRGMGTRDVASADTEEFVWRDKHFFPIFDVSFHV